MPPRGQAVWPYFHEQPDCVVLPPRPDATPSSLPPVRIFLGTQPAQYRAERIFFWSIEQHRDPSRRYEIYLMSDLAGFDRRGWRTGFTKYRFAIPELAGGEGKAIYNDVDQIYLADPGLLFDLDMGSHGYLAISPEETSVMLIDCVKMEPIWNRFTANRQGKQALIKRPAKTKGLWGAIDGHWNARDMEYVEGRTKCLHYTLLHEQPWEPTPEAYSYHANPLGYIWHRLERSADQAGYRVFTSAKPSDDFRRLAVRNDSWPAAQPVTLARAILQRLMGAGVRRLLIVGFGGEPEVENLPYGIDVLRVDLARLSEVQLDERFDAVLACQLLERLPPADIPWVMDGLFAQADRLALIDVQAKAVEGFAGPAWWERRIREAAASHPGKSWHLEAHPDPRFASTGPLSVTTYRSADPGMPDLWVLLTGQDVVDRQSLALVARLGWPFTAKRLERDGRRYRLPELVGARPDLVVAGGDGAACALQIRERSGERTRLVQIGRPHAPFELFDLILATPEERLPIRGNVMQLAAPLAGIDANSLLVAAAAWSERLAGAQRPFAGVFVGAGHDGYVVDAAAAEKAAADLVHELEEWQSGTLLVRYHEGIAPLARSAFARKLGEGPIVEVVGDPAEAHAALIALADALFVTADDLMALGEAAHSGKPLTIIDLPKRHERRPIGRHFHSIWGLATGGGITYRGTPHQQHFLGRWLDRNVTHGKLDLSIEPAALHRALIARGLARRCGQSERVASPQPLDDLDLAVARVRATWCERRIVG